MRSKGQISLNFKSQSRFQRFYTKLLTNLKIENILNGIFILLLGSCMPQGRDFRGTRVKNFSKGICDGVPSTVHSSIYLCLSSNVLFVFVISKSPVTLLNRLMFFSGVGISVVLITGCIVIYYNVVVAYCIFYFFASMTGTLPWTYCDQDWNTCYCRDSTMEINSTTPWENSTKLFLECSEYITKPIHHFIQEVEP